MGSHGRLLVTLGGINAVGIVSPSAAGAEIDGPDSNRLVSERGRDRFQRHACLRLQPQEPIRPQSARLQARPRQIPEPAQRLRRRQSIYLAARKGRHRRFPDCPTRQALAATTLQVAKNIGLPAAAERAAAVRRMAPVARRIKHVVFIIKENRTYDQVLGDLDEAMAIRTSRSSASLCRPTITGSRVSS